MLLAQGLTGVLDLVLAAKDAVHEVSERSIEVLRHAFDPMVVVGAADSGKALAVLGESAGPDHPEQRMASQPVGTLECLGDVSAHMPRDLAGFVRQDHEGFLVSCGLGRCNLGVDGDERHVIRQRQLQLGDLPDPHAGLVDADHLAQTEREGGMSTARGEGRGYC
ncbi:hypothetical protein D3C86_1620570 [compost metagenome]